MTPDQRQRVEAELTADQLQALKQIMDDLGLPFEDWPSAGSVATAFRYAAGLNVARRLREQEGLSLTESLQTAGSRLGLARSTLPAFKDRTMRRTA